MGWVKDLYEIAWDLWDRLRGHPAAKEFEVVYSTLVADGVHADNIETYVQRVLGEATRLVIPGVPLRANLMIDRKDRLELYLHHSPGTPFHGKDFSLPIGHGVAGRAHEIQEMVYLPSIGHPEKAFDVVQNNERTYVKRPCDPKFVASPLRPPPYRCILAVPIRTRFQTAAVMNLDGEKDDVFGDRHDCFARAQAFGRILALVLQRHWAERALIEYNRKVEQIEGKKTAELPGPLPQPTKGGDGS